MTDNPATQPELLLVDLLNQAGQALVGAKHGDLSPSVRDRLIRRIDDALLATPAPVATDKARARELLAAEYRAEGFAARAEEIEQSLGGQSDDLAIRAIEAALNPSGNEG